MCGIFGHIGYLPTQLAENCISKLTHRGPDGNGLWQQGEAILGHRRLAILDLTEQGKQPMSYSNGRYWITFNGEIYNFIEIRYQLQKKGYRFKSDTDTEVILAAFIEWGEACQDKFNGMWAFAIWDCEDQSLFLARDRFGVKPLFYAFVPSGFVFASEMKAIFPLLPEVRPNIPLVTQMNGQKIIQYESEDCLIESIKRFPSGHCGWFRDGKLSLRRWWCTLDHLMEVPERYEEQVEQFRNLFLDACRLRMRSDVPIGTALSGGLDSSSVISAIAHIGRTDKSLRISQDWQHAVIATFPGTPLDESLYAKQVTDHLGIDPTFVEIDPLKTIDRLYEYFYLCEDIYLTSPIPFMMIYDKLKTNGVKVSLDGHAADELFGGYSFDYMTALVDAGLNLKEVNNILNILYDGFPKDSSQFSLPPKWKYWLEWHGRRQAKQLLGRSPSPSRDASHHQYEKLDALNKTLYVSTHETILPTLLRNYDRYSMANGVEIRMPFMDYRIACFAFSIPWTSKLRNGFSKAILRDAVAGLMPRDIAYRKTKIGLNSPIVDWMKGPLKSFFLDTISCTSFKTCNLINPVAVAAKIQQAIEDPNTSFALAEQAWIMLTPYLWEQAVINRGASNLTASNF